MSFLISFLYPITVFIILRFFDIKLDDMFFLKLLPLIISSYVLFLITLSYFKDSSFILKFAKKFSKKELSSEEINYIKKSTLFWAGVSLINVILHIIVVLHANEYYWLTYSTFGWYFVFITGGILQFLHKKFVFLKKLDNSELKGKEEFVAKSLESHFDSAFNSAQYRKGEDPPDIYLDFSTKEIPVEITELNANVLRNKKKISKNTSKSNLKLVSSSIIKDRLEDKNTKCSHLNQPIWLALYDNYFNKFTDFKDKRHIDFYNEVMQEIKDFGMFEKILIVFENSDVLEFNNA